MRLQMCKLVYYMHLYSQELGDLNINYHGMLVCGSRADEIC
jgi:hypothetical protein